MRKIADTGINLLFMPPISPPGQSEELNKSEMSNGYIWRRINFSSILSN